jgi:predicted DNA-binding transcriptional regulator AlpA
MLPTMTSDERIGLAEAARLLGVAKNTVLRYARRADFPAPAETLASGRLWRRSEIEAWARAHLPLRPGRPRRERS